jgi:hypothetical protein
MRSAAAKNPAAQPFERGAIWRSTSQAALANALLSLASEQGGFALAERRRFIVLSERKVFCAIRPMRTCSVWLGLAVPAEICPRLDPRARGETWSKRLGASVLIQDNQEIDDELRALMRLARSQS